MSDPENKDHPTSGSHEPDSQPIPAPHNPLTSSRLRAVLGLLTLTLIGLAAIALITQDINKLRTFLESSGLFGLLLAILLYGLLGASPVPSEPLTVMLSTITGPLATTIIAVLGNYLAALLEYFIGYRMGDLTNFTERREKLPFGLGRFPANSIAFLLLARSLPGYGPKMVSLVAGAYRVPLWRYTWTCLLSLTWATAFLAFGGYQLLRLIFPWLK